MENRRICAMHCYRKDCVWQHSGICCCYKDELKYDKYCNCASYAKKNRVAELHKETLSLFEKGDVVVLPDNLLGYHKKKGGRANQRVCEIVNVSENYTEVICIDNPKFSLRTTVWNHDLIDNEMNRRKGLEAVG